MCIVQRLDRNGGASFECAQSGCQECVERLLREHERLVYAVMKQQWAGGAEYGDLIQAGRIGLWQAILNYDEGRGVKFSTYAWQSIRRHIWREVKAEREAKVGLEVRRLPDGWNVLVKKWEQEQIEAGMREGLSCLPERLRQVIVQAYGLEGEQRCSLAAIGREMGVSRERVRQLRNDGLTLMRLPELSVRLRVVWERNDRRSYRQAQALNRAWLGRRRK